VPPNVRFCADDIEAMVILSLCSCVWRSASNDYFRGSKDDAFQVLIDIASALEYLHGLGLDHNDIKPGNVLLSKERGAVLCDFGPTRRTVLGAMSGGTAWYIPPEYITVSQRGQPGGVFALGVTALYLSKLLSLPDVSGRGFIIADIHSRKTELQQAARNKMASWLTKCEAAKAQLDLSSTEAFTIRGMLSPRTTIRPTAAELVKRLNSELYRRNHRPQVKEKISDRVTGGGERGGLQKSIDHGSTTEENESIE
jgi:serine/threonine protein kinase